MGTRPGAVVSTCLLACLLLLGGCGDDAAAPGGGPGPSTSGTVTSQPSQDGPVPYRDVAVVSGVDAGGSLSSLPVPLRDEAALDTWVSQFASPAMREDLRTAVEEAWPGTRAAGEVLLGAVLAVGCETPQAWSLERAAGDLRVQVRMPKPTRQCLVAVTTVGLLAVPQDETAGLAGPQ